ncbi:MAG: cytochrome c biogenesis protein CcsA [Cytophagaceae bacterium]|nr:cytochrome c biogenesis protein CcsA [Cytophagaceae bacterium]
MEIAKKAFLKLTSTRAAGIYILLFAIAIGVATFVENDFGTSSAQKLIFKSKWFELLLLLFSISILANISRYNLIKQKKWASLLFHLSIIIILIGSAVTRYTGFEGMMHIREGNTSNKYLTTESYLKFRIDHDGRSYSFDEPIEISSLGNNNFEKSYQIGNKLLEVNLDEVLPNPVEKVVASSEGKPMLKVVIGGAGGREEYFLSQGQQQIINGLYFNFSDKAIPNAFNIQLVNNSLVFSSDQVVNQMVMATQEVKAMEPNQAHPLLLRSLYTVGESSFVVGEFIEKGEVKIESGNKKLNTESLAGLTLTVKENGKSKNAMVIGRPNEEGQPTFFEFDGLKMAVSYGSRIDTLPFYLTCRDFILEKYPGTENPSSYASEVTLSDKKENINRDQRIFMNNILQYKGYRFFQSSFDQDELGTYLSVNHDFWGTWISYLGYALLTLGMILNFFDKKSRFSDLLRKLNTTSAKVIVTISFSLLALSSSAQQVSPEHAKAFGKLMVQDMNGRIKPMNSLSNEILRKLSRKESLAGQSAEQVILSMMLDPENFANVEIIQIPDHPQVKELLKTDKRLLSYNAFFGEDGSYLMSDEVKAAQNMMPKDQGTFEKALIKIDEKVNIVNMVFSGSLFRWFPQVENPTAPWLTPADLMEEYESKKAVSKASNLFWIYVNSVNAGIKSGNFAEADKQLEQIINFQKASGGAIIPSETKINSEIFLNKIDAFNRLKGFYGILSLVLTGLFLYGTIKKSKNTEKWTRWAYWAMFIGFLFHTLGLGLRWYISGRAPWSNGYESMIYIGWTTVLGGLLISRKSLGGLAATATLAATILFVASMSWLDPEITPLVPVLKSYWLTIHVSLEAGSYGFLLLGAVIGMLNLVLMVFLKEENKANIERTIKELTIISEITLTTGLVMVSVGTYLGGVWANESWGRYWGWDAKETWALVTILVYAFILHMRLIPKVRGAFAFNFASLFGFGTVIMTYLGVNYYLSGLHSYAAGDPVPVPPSVYYTVLVLTVLSILAYLKYKKYLKPAK